MGPKIKHTCSELLTKSTTLWVFGYGSLLWKPNFAYTKRAVGYIKGFVRRFWQGNTHHRGTPESPGRVATLIKDQLGKVWGVAYELVGVDQIAGAIGHLQNREIDVGGYTTYIENFYERGCEDKPFPVIIYTATPENELYLGDAHVDDLADQILTSKGHCGHNVEYVTKLVEFIQEHIPEDEDEHLFELHEKIQCFKGLKRNRIEAKA